MRRRAFFIVLSSLFFAWPFAIRGQPTKIPVIGFLNSESAATAPGLLAAFHRGLNASGYFEGRNVAIEYRWADGHSDRLQQLAADLVQRRVDLIVATGGTDSARAAASATDTVPVVFADDSNPVGDNLLASSGRPGRNTAGVSLHTTHLVAKRLELLRELVPNAVTIALLVDRISGSAEAETKEFEKAAVAAGLKAIVLNAETSVQAALATAGAQEIDALLVSADPLLTPHRKQIVELAAARRLPAIYPWREYSLAGGLMSYSPSMTDAFRQIGDYAGRILKGIKPSDLPIQLPTRFELTVNLKTAKALGLDVPRALVVAANEVVE